MRQMLRPRIRQRQGFAYVHLIPSAKALVRNGAVYPKESPTNGSHCTDEYHDGHEIVHLETNTSGGTNFAIDERDDEVDEVRTSSLFQSRQRKKAFIHPKLVGKQQLMKYRYTSPSARTASP